jgi:hypothetical protein
MTSPSERPSAEPAAPDEDAFDAELPPEPPAPAEQVSIFTPADHLKLLQLQARRAIAERAARGQPPEQPEDVEAPDAGGSAASKLPDVWRLVPPRVSLHAWQAECLPLWLRAA